MDARKMKYDPLFGSISYESRYHGWCRLLDYADDWKLASGEEKDQIRLAAASPATYEACKAVLETLNWTTIAHSDSANGILSVVPRLKAAIKLAEEG
jgi:hypothetical protein